VANDIKLKYNSDLMEYDIELEDGGSDLIRESGLETAIFISLFTDRRANADDKLHNDGEFKGWWGDRLEDGDKIGSRLWLIDGKATQENIRKTEGYIKEALQWIIDDEVAAKFDVIVEHSGDRLDCEIKIYYADGTKESFKYIDLWEAQIGV
jgi:phage gp46-like protein